MTENRVVQEGRATLPALLTIRETAALLRCDIHFVYRLAYDGSLPTVKLGAWTWRARSADLLSMIKAGSIPSPGRSKKATLNRSARRELNRI